MDLTRRTQLIKQRAVARGMLSCIQIFIEVGDHKINELQVRFNKLPEIFNRYDTAQSELELSDDRQFRWWELFETQYYQVEAKFSELHPVIEQTLFRRSSPLSSLSGHSNQSPRSHVSSTHIKLPVMHCRLSKVRMQLVTLQRHFWGTNSEQHSLVQCSKIPLPHCFTSEWGQGSDKQFTDHKWKLSCCLATSNTTLQ